MHKIIKDYKKSLFSVLYLHMAVTLVALLKLHLTMHVSLWVFRAADLLNITTEHQLLKDCITGRKKRHLMILRPGSYGLYPTSNTIFRINNNKARII